MLLPRILTTNFTKYTMNAHPLSVLKKAHLEEVILTKVSAVQRDDLQIIIVDTWSEKQI